MTREGIQRALLELEAAFDEFRMAYAAWLSDDGDAIDLADALSRAQDKLDRAREALASTDEATT
jgi:hypothetical protein